MEKQAVQAGIWVNICRFVFLILTLITGVALLIGGAKLLSLGGSSYYLLAGIAYLLITVLYFKRNKLGLWLSVATFVATVIWALYEVQINYWLLVSRLVVPAIILMLSLWLTSTFKDNFASTCKRNANIFGVVVFAGLIITFVAAFFPHGVISNDVAITQNEQLAKVSPENPDNWQYFGRNTDATKFAPYSDITPDNVNQLEVAWTYNTGRVLTGAAGVDANTPLQIGATLYSCTPTNILTAIDADTGKAIWKFDPQAKTEEHVTCRGVGYYDESADTTIPKVTYNEGQQCVQRILMNTVDARLMAVDAHTGELCQGFGKNGSVDLKDGMGETRNSRYYHPTAAPTIFGHLAVLGGWVFDISPKANPGVVRAYDTRTGELVWTWDPRNQDHNTAPAEGQTYAMGTPNVWAPPSFDKDLNLIFLPTGNGPTDYWGGERKESEDKFGSAVVAVDAATGKTKWLFQTVHHDVWDFDVPSQPALYTLKNKQGEDVPALIQTSKSGQIFVLDRRNGQPLYDVEERPVPQTPSAQGEKLSPTQPFSVELPNIGTEPLTEAKMWGLSTFDQLWCRIDFKSSNYQGLFTPPTEQPYIQWPNLTGSLNWGGVSIDESRGLMFVNSIEIAVKLALITREEAKKYEKNTDEVPGFFGTVRPQDAGPYGGIRIDYFFSPLGVPCTRPPFGSMTAIDLKSKKIVWQVPLGTVEDTGPKGIKTHMPMPIGMPTVAGPTSTASGLVFFAGTQDYYLRAFNSLTGKEVWKKRMPVGAGATPIVYKSPKTGKQYVVISAGGVNGSPDRGDYIIAYALPDKK